MGRIQFHHTYDDIISIENLLEAWKEFVNGKRVRKDVQEFERNLMMNICALHRDLSAKTYIHSVYEAFKIADPKPRDIHKAMVRDRLLHHALHRKLVPFFERTFIADSASCQRSKGTHYTLRRFKKFVNIVSKNNTQTVWVLKGDIKKFFASIDQGILLKILRKYISSPSIIELTSGIVQSFHSSTPDVGLPLGNLTSQLLVNIYMNEFDQYVKHCLKAKYYIRYADDFAVVSRDRVYLEKILIGMQDFLWQKLKLMMHSNKVFIATIASGVDFLGWVHFPDHRVLRTSTKRRMFARLQLADSPQVRQSYLGLLRHGNTKKLQARISADAPHKNAHFCRQQQGAEWCPSTEV